MIRLLAQALHIGYQQVSIGLVVRAPHAAAQLVELCQPEFVGAADDDGVGAWHVDAGFDDGGAQQQVVTLGHKVAHHTLQLALGHLAVGNGDTCLGQQFLQFVAPGQNRFDLVVQKIDLPAALEFAQNRFADGAVALVAHKSLDR